MKNKIIAISVILISVTVGSLFLWKGYQKPKTNPVVIESKGDGKGVFVGERRPQYKESDPNKWSPETRKRVEEYEASVKSIDDSWKYFGLANSYFKVEKYEEAIEAYKKAYQTGKGDESFFGMELLKAYEKLHRYDEALALLDEIKTKYYKSDYGVQRAQEIRSRLLAAKNATAPQS